MGQVFQRSYRAADGTTKTCRTWTLRYHRNGRAIQEATKFTRKGDALTLLKTREGDIAKGLPVSRASITLTFDAAVADVVNDYKANGKRTTEHVERRIRLHLAPAFGGRRLSSITTAQIRAFIAQRQAPIPQDDGTTIPGASNAEINRELAILKRACRLAQQGGALLVIPHIPMLRESNVRQGFFERAEFEAVREALPAPLRPVVTFAYLTGWRVPSEVLTLEWGQVDREAQTVRLDPGTTKNAEGRTFPYALLPELVELIASQWAEHERLKSADVICPFVFPRPSGKAVKHFRKAWATACVTAGVPGRLPHDFRRTAVRNLVRAGVPEKTAMALTGHKTRSVFDRYDIVNEADLRDAVGKLATVTVSGQSPESARVLPLRRSS
ncbi:MAG TPA: tyrosine-type recombinase/integrase [Vicinamibacterales bacterium]